MTIVFTALAEGPVLKNLGCGVGGTFYIYIYIYFLNTKGPVIKHWAVRVFPFLFFFSLSAEGVAAEECI